MVHDSKPEYRSNTSNLIGTLWNEQEKYNIWRKRITTDRTVAIVSFSFPPPYDQMTMNYVCITETSRSQCKKVWDGVELSWGAYIVETSSHSLLMTLRLAALPPQNEIIYKRHVKKSGVSIQAYSINTDVILYKGSGSMFGKEDESWIKQLKMYAYTVHHKSKRRRTNLHIGV